MCDELGFFTADQIVELLTDADLLYCPKSIAVVFAHALQAHPSQSLQPAVLDASAKLETAREKHAANSMTQVSSGSLRHLLKATQFLAHVPNKRYRLDLANRLERHVAIQLLLLCNEYIQHSQQRQAAEPDLEASGSATASDLQSSCSLLWYQHRDGCPMRNEVIQMHAVHPPT